MQSFIRSAEKKDLDKIIEYQIRMAYETEGIQLDKDTLTAGVHAAFSDDTRGQYYIAEIDRKIVGSFLITYEWSDWRNGTFLWMQSVYVEKEYRQKGVFKAMYQYLKNKVLKNDNLKGIRLYVSKTNTIARKVYLRMGMVDHQYEMFGWIK